MTIWGEESAFSWAGNEDECRHWKQGEDGAEIIVAKSAGVRYCSKKNPRPFPAAFQKCASRHRQQLIVQDFYLSYVSLT